MVVVKSDIDGKLIKAILDLMSFILEIYSICVKKRMVSSLKLVVGEIEIIEDGVSHPG